MPAIEWERMVYFENGKPVHRVREYDLDDVWMGENDAGSRKEESLFENAQ